eukprot:6894202-Pyramimonas_sp.AAC.1
MTVAAWRRHQLKHNPIDPAQKAAWGNQCGACGRIFGNRSLLIKHLRNVGSRCLLWLEQHAPLLDEAEAHLRRQEDLLVERDQTHIGYHRLKVFQKVRFESNDGVEGQHWGGRGDPYCPIPPPTIHVTMDDVPIRLSRTSLGAVDEVHMLYYNDDMSECCNW